MAALLYHGDLSGIPDDGPVPVPMLPAFLFHVRSEDEWVRHCWVLACFAYVLPSMFCGLKSWREGTLMSAVTIVASLPLLRMPEPMHTDYAPTFSVALLVEGLIWLVGLTAIGTLLGNGVRLTRADRSESDSRRDRST